VNPRAALDVLGTRLRAARTSTLVQNTLWVTGLSAFERVLGVVQTLVISHALGITEYGVYGLLFGTIGFVASVIGLQMGLTATVFVARYKTVEPAKAAAVISIVGRFGWIAGLGFVAIAAPLSGFLSVKLVGAPGHTLPVLLGIFFVATSIMSGVQDGTAQGFEMFGALARLKIVTALVALALVYPAAARFGLAGAMTAILAGLLIKLFVLRIMVSRKREAAGLPSHGSGVSFVELVHGFAVPSMLVSLVAGFVTWYGMFLLSKQSSGFDSVAIVNTGIQWRGPLLLLATSVGTVAVPTFSRLDAQRDVGATRRLLRNLMLLNFGGSLLVAGVLAAGSGWLLSLYGPGFAQGRFAFSLIVLSCVPTVTTQPYMQHLVGASRMWRQFFLQCPHFLAWLICLVTLVPAYHAAGYASAMLIASLVLAISTYVADNIDLARAQARGDNQAVA